jgi:hypothetical protein
LSNWKNNTTQHINLPDLYTILFTEHSCFSEWEHLKKQQSTKSFEHFQPIFEKLRLLSLKTPENS